MMLTLMISVFILMMSFAQSFHYKSLNRCGTKLAFPTSLKLSMNNNDIPQSAIHDAKDRLRVSVIPFLASFTLLAPQLLGPQIARAEGEVATATPAALGAPPTDFILKYKDYYADCQQVVNHMRYAVQLEKGNPLIAEVAQKTKAEMNEFVSYYRRFQGISGKQTFSLLYTSINVLAGHYTSYGVKFPVPEKRRKRLLQEFNDIEKNIKKRR